MKCFYHSADQDGRCSGAIVKEVHPECELTGINYGQAFPWDTIQSDELVYMVDFSLQPFTDMIRLKEACGALVWIDHHKSAIEERDAAGVSFNGMQVVGKSGCELVWECIVGSDMPRAVFLLGRYDVWDWMNHPGAMEFQKGVWQFNTDPNNSEFWHRLFIDDELVEEITHDGALLLAAQKKDNWRLTLNRVGTLVMPICNKNILLFITKGGCMNIEQILNDEGYQTVNCANAVLDAINSVAGPSTPKKWRCSGYRVFPDGTKCEGCGDCTERGE